MPVNSNNALKFNFPEKVGLPFNTASDINSENITTMLHSFIIRPAFNPTHTMATKRDSAMRSKASTLDDRTWRQMPCTPSFR